MPGGCAARLSKSLPYFRLDSVIFHTHVQSGTVYIILTYIANTRLLASKHHFLILLIFYHNFAVSLLVWCNVSCQQI